MMLRAMTMIPMLWVVMPRQIFGTPLCSVSLVLSLSTTFILLLELITGPQTLSNGHGQSQKGMILDWVNSYAHICVLFTAFNSQVGDINTHVPLLQVRELKEEKKLDKLVDRDLKDSFDVAELECSVDVIIQCTQTNPILWPKMSEVLHALGANVALAESSIELNREPLPYGGPYSFSVRHEDPHDSSSFIIEPIELSGPRLQLLL